MNDSKQADVVPHLHYKGAPSFKGPPVQIQTLDQSEDIALERIQSQAENQGSLPVVDTQSVADAERSSQLSAPQGTTNSDSNSNTRLPFRAHVMYATTLVMMFLAGWNDGTTGPLLPRIQVAYNIGFAVVSLIFVFNFLGFAVAAALNVYLTDRFGFGKVLAFGAVSQLVGYAFEAPAPPFPIFVLGQFFMGLGIALQLSGANTFVAGLKQHVSTRLAVLHACYGAGALAAPLVATQFSQMPRWSFHYLVSLGLALINVCVISFVYRFRTFEALLTEIGIPPTANDRDNGRSGSKYRQIMRLRDVHLIALFILIYVGTEVTLGGWIVTYIIDLRGGGPSSGYISSGFFGGLMVGRIVLLGVNKLVGERRAIFLYATLCVGLEIVVWLVPSLVGGAVAVAGVGMLLGPLYPLVMSHTRRVFPPYLLSGCIGWIAAIGQSGSAFLPFVTGALASKVGIKVLQPVVVSMMALMVGVWALVPNSPRRFD